VADARGWTLLVYLGVVPTAVAYALYAIGLRTTRVTVSGVLTLLEPLTATLLGVLFFGDRLGQVGAVGAALLLVAVLGLTSRR
jgi:DME family drug/metabolite transporter